MIGWGRNGLALLPALNGAEIPANPVTFCDGLHIGLSLFAMAFFVGRCQVVVIVGAPKLPTDLMVNIVMLVCANLDLAQPANAIVGKEDPRPLVLSERGAFRGVAHHAPVSFSDP